MSRTPTRAAGKTRAAAQHAVHRHMTPSPHSIGKNQTLSVAHQIMRDHGLRHLPVLDGGKLVGILSQRDLYFIETLKDVDPESTEVAEAMTEGAYAVSPEAPLHEVATTMAEQKLGCAVVVDQASVVVGIFTAVDALRVLGELLRARASAR